MDKEKYQGWSNRFTWIVNLWISNERGDYEYWREQAAEIREQHDMRSKRGKEDAARDLADRMEASFEEGAEMMLEEARRSGTFWADIVSAALANVNWLEVAKSWIEEE